MNAGTYGCVGCRNQITDKKQLNAERTYFGCGLSSMMAGRGTCVSWREHEWPAYFLVLVDEKAKRGQGVEVARRKVTDTVYKVLSC